MCKMLFFYEKNSFHLNLKYTVNFIEKSICISFFYFSIDLYIF